MSEQPTNEVLEEPPYVVPFEQHNHNKPPYCDKSRIFAAILLVVSLIALGLIGYFGNRR